MAQNLIYELTPNNFQECPLKDGNGNNFGSLYLCTDSSLANQPLPDPVSASGAPFPGPSSSNATTFPDVFLQLASTIAQYVSQMNQELKSLHVLSIGGARYSPPPNPPNSLTPGLQNYTVLAAQLSQALGWGLPGQKGKGPQFWPLVPFNPKWSLTQSPAWVTTQNIPNNNFKSPTSECPAPSGWPDHKNAFYLYTTVPGDVNQNAIGAIEFWQDCEWPQNPSNDKDWSSWGFITNFGLTLFEIVPAPGLTAGISSSSSSSSYYAASSAMGNPRGHHHHG